jgi:hypothetical protein
MWQQVVDFRAPSQGDINYLADNLRRQDAEEILAAGHVDARTAIVESVNRSMWCYAAHTPDGLAAIFGLAPLPGTSVLDPRGVPWLLGTDLIVKHRRALVRLAPGYIRRMLGTHPHLVNLVHARNTMAVRWLQSAGFELGPAQPIRLTGEPFRYFEMRAHV